MGEKEIFQIETFLINLRYFSKVIDKKIVQRLKQDDVDISEIFCLLILKREKKGLSMRELTMISKVNKSMTTKVIQKLESKMLIYRDRVSPKTRNYKIYLTELGWDKASKIEEALLIERKKFEDNLTQEEKELIVKACTCIMQKCINCKD